MRRKIQVLSLTIILVLVLSSMAAVGAEEIRIYHTNDSHGRIEAGSYAGMGFARIKTLIDEGKQELDNVLYLDAGDAFHGQLITNLNDGEAAVHILNVMGCDALTLGNHDFNYGQKQVKELADIASFPLLAANLVNEDGSDSDIAENYIIKDMGDVEIGIIGLATPETAYKTHPKNVEGLVFADPVETATEMVAELEDKVDVIVVLAHLGLSEGSEYTSRDVAENVDGIDVIIDGHSHHALEEGIMVNNTLIAMAYEYTKSLGVVDLTVENGQVVSKKASLINKEDVMDDVEENKIISRIVEGINDANESITSVEVGEAAVILDGERENVRTGETNLGNMVADALREAMDADIALTNGGGIRASIPAGTVTAGDVITVLPFGNTGMAKELTGEQVLAALEHGVSQYPATEGLFPQVSGVKFSFDPAQPAGERIVEVTVNGESLAADETYVVATNDFMAAGGDGYEMLMEAETVGEVGGLEELVMNYIDENSPVAPEVEGRITVLE